MKLTLDTFASEKIILHLLNPSEVITWQGKASGVHPA